MKKIRSRCKAACLVAFVLLFLSAGSVRSYAAETKSGSENTTITVASNVSEQEMEPYLNAFRQKYPGIQVDYTCYSDYENEIGEQIASGDYPDVLFIPGSISPENYADYFEPLGTKEDLGKKYDYLQGSKVVENTIYGIPSSAYVNGLIYNKEVFDKAGITEPPKSISEFLESLNMIKERTDAIPFYTNYAAGWTLQAWEQYPFIAMTGDPDYKENGFVNELDPFLQGTTHYEVYQLLYDIVKDGLCEETPENSDWEQSKILMNEGKIGCMAIGSWALKQVQDAGNNPDAIGYMPFPNEVDGKQYMTIVTDYCYGINKNSTQKEAARAYIDYMLDESGYALDHEVLSLVKTDPILESYGDMQNVICLCNNQASDENYRKRQILSTNLNILDSTDEIKRVIEAAEGKRDESFDEIASDWNERWESSRTEDMMPGDAKHTTVLGSALSKNYEIEFSDTEREYIDGLSELRIGYLKNMAPFQYEQSGDFQGFLKGIMDIVADDLGVSLVEKGYDNTEQMVRALHEGDIDMIVGMDKSSGYGSGLKFSAKSLDVMKVMVKSDSKKANDALKGSMAQITGEDYSDLQTEASKIIETDDLVDSLGAIETLKADFTVSDYYGVYYYTQEQGFEHLDITPISGSSSLCFAYAKECDTRLISMCNKVLYSIPDENKQIMLDESMKNGNQQVTLKRFIEANTIPCLVAVNLFFGIILILIVIMARQRAKMVRMDALTGLYNRYGIRWRMKQFYDKKHFPMIFSILDIDRFKSVNDTLGYLGGDEALKLLADNMKEVFGNRAVLGRYGGDEFVIGFYGKDLAEAEKKFGELVTRMDRRFAFGEAEVDLSISVGVVIVEEEVSYDDLFKTADQALYSVKEKGKNNYRMVSYKSIYKQK